jgi:RNA 3'-terminal phosphate cyclase (ATP)
MSKKTIEIDGALGEGGGQVLRTSLALSLITHQPFHLRKVRAGRAKPGLQAQHLMCVKAAAQIGGARVRGDKLGSGDLVFEPGEVVPGNYRFQIGTAGATSLVVHTVYLPLALAGASSTIDIEGGTHVIASPCFQFLDRTWAAYMRALGIAIEVQLARCGFYPRGGGLIHALVQPSPNLRSFHGMTGTSVTSATVISGSAGLPSHVAERLAERAGQRVSEMGLEVTSRVENWQGGPGCMVGIELPTEPAPTFLFALGERGKPAEKVGDEAAAQVAAFLEAAPLGVDAHSADQLLLPLALAPEPSQFRVAEVTSHLRTNAYVIQHFLDRSIQIDGSEGEPGQVIIS